MTALLRLIAKSLAALAVIACATLPACSARSEERVLETWYLFVKLGSGSFAAVPLAYPSLVACKSAAERASTIDGYPLRDWVCVPHHF